MGTNVDIYSVSTLSVQHPLRQYGSSNRRSEFRKVENMDKPVTKGENFNVAGLSLLQDFWGNNCPHVILTAEADSLPTDEQKLLHDYGLVGCHSSRSNDLSVSRKN